MPEITMVENSPELISNIIINLKNNNASLDFLFNEKNILNSIGAHLKLKKNSNQKHLKYKENYPAKIGITGKTKEHFARWTISTIFK